MKVALRLLTCAASIALYSQSGWADYVSYSVGGPHVYFSTDMRPIEISFATGQFDEHSKTIKPVRFDPEKKLLVEKGPMLVANIPRAYVMYANRYSSSRKAQPGFRYDVLPDKIISDHVQLGVSYPDGLPLSVSYDAFHRNNPDLSKFGGRVPEIRKDKQARAIVLLAHIHSFNDPFPPYDFFTPKYITDGKKQIGHAYGFEHYQHGGSIQEYLDNGPDGIRRISCYGDAARTPVGYYCTYSFPLNKFVYVDLRFLDFRVHGGRAFARARIRAFKKFACPILHCDEVALRAAEVQGDVP